MGIRAARQSDLPGILDIYNHAVVNTTATFDLEPRSPEAQPAWFLEHAPPHPAIVWEEGGRVQGWASLSPYASRCAYRFAAEASVYVAVDSRRAGIGERGGILDIRHKLVVRALGFGVVRRRHICRGLI